jgi:hypothetical protein
MQTLEEQFKKLLIESLDNDNEAAKELAQEAAIKMASNFTEARLVELLGEFTNEHIESRMFRD